MEKKLDMKTRKSILQSFINDYKKASKKEKSKILDVYIQQTLHNRKYVISKLNSKNIQKFALIPKKRKSFYDYKIIEYLKILWELFDQPCGQRLKHQIHNELDRLIKFNEINPTKEEREKLLKISSVTIDRKLKKHKKNQKLKTNSVTPKGNHFRSKIPQNLTWSNPSIGYVEIDLVAHNGGNPYGDYIYTLSVTDIATQWWEGQAIKGKGSFGVKQALQEIKKRIPFKLKGIDSDNGSEFINDQLLQYCKNNGIEFTRSRPYHKNDNAYVEQKNWTHVRKMMGNHRFDIEAELLVLNHLYSKELATYKNFFQVNYKLESKEWIHNKRIRQYEKNLMTPYQRVIASDKITSTEKENLKNIYENLNPAELKRKIDKTIQILFTVNQQKSELLRKYGT